MTARCTTVPGSPQAPPQRGPTQIGGVDGRKTGHHGNLESSPSHGNLEGHGPGRFSGNPSNLRSGSSRTPTPNGTAPGGIPHQNYTNIYSLAVLRPPKFQPKKPTPVEMRKIEALQEQLHIVTRKLELERRCQGKLYEIYNDAVRTLELTLKPTDQRPRPQSSASTAISTQMPGTDTQYGASGISFWGRGTGRTTATGISSHTQTGQAAAGGASSRPQTAKNVKAKASAAGARPQTAAAGGRNQQRPGAELRTAPNSNDMAPNAGGKNLGSSVKAAGQQGNLGASLSNTGIGSIAASDGIGRSPKGDANVFEQGGRLDSYESPDTGKGKIASPSSDRKQNTQKTDSNAKDAKTKGKGKAKGKKGKGKPAPVLQVQRVPSDVIGNCAEMVETAKFDPDDSWALAEYHRQKEEAEMERQKALHPENFPEEEESIEGEEEEEAPKVGEIKKTMDNWRELRTIYEKKSWTLDMLTKKLFQKNRDYAEIDRDNNEIRRKCDIIRKETVTQKQLLKDLLIKAVKMDSKLRNHSQGLAESKLSIKAIINEVKTVDRARKRDARKFQEALELCYQGLLKIEDQEKAAVCKQYLEKPWAFYKSKFNEPTSNVVPANKHKALSRGVSIQSLDSPRVKERSAQLEPRLSPTTGKPTGRKKPVPKVREISPGPYVDKAKAATGTAMFRGHSPSKNSSSKNFPTGNDSTEPPEESPPEINERFGYTICKEEKNYSEHSLQRDIIRSAFLNTVYRHKIRNSKERILKHSRALDHVREASGFESVNDLADVLVLIEQEDVSVLSQIVWKAEEVLKEEAKIRILKEEFFARRSEILKKKKEMNIKLQKLRHQIWVHNRDHSHYKKACEKQQTMLNQLWPHLEGITKQFQDVIIELRSQIWIDKNRKTISTETLPQTISPVKSSTSSTKDHQEGDNNFNSCNDVNHAVDNGVHNTTSKDVEYAVDNGVYNTTSKDVDPAVDDGVHNGAIAGDDGEVQNGSNGNAEVINGNLDSSSKDPTMAHTADPTVVHTDSSTSISYPRKRRRRPKQVENFLNYGIVQILENIEMIFREKCWSLDVENEHRLEDFLVFIEHFADFWLRNTIPDKSIPTMIAGLSPIGSSEQEAKQGGKDAPTKGGLKDNNVTMFYKADGKISDGKISDVYQCPPHHAHAFLGGPNSGQAPGKDIHGKDYQRDPVTGAIRLIVEPPECNLNGGDLVRRRFEKYGGRSGKTQDNSKGDINNDEDGGSRKSQKKKLEIGTKISNNKSAGRKKFESETMILLREADRFVANSIKGKTDQNQTMAAILQKQNEQEEADRHRAEHHDDDISNLLQKVGDQQSGPSPKQSIHQTPMTFDQILDFVERPLFYADLKPKISYLHKNKKTKKAVTITKHHGHQHGHHHTSLAGHNHTSLLAGHAPPPLLASPLAGIMGGDGSPSAAGAPPQTQAISGTPSAVSSAVSRITAMPSAMPSGFSAITSIPSALSAIPSSGVSGLETPLTSPNAAAMGTMMDGGLGPPVPPSRIPSEGLIFQEMQSDGVFPTTPQNGGAQGGDNTALLGTQPSQTAVSGGVVGPGVVGGTTTASAAAGTVSETTMALGSAGTGGSALQHAGSATVALGQTVDSNLDCTPGQLYAGDLQDERIEAIAAGTAPPTQESSLVKELNQQTPFGKVLSRVPGLAEKIRLPAVTEIASIAGIGDTLSNLKNYGGPAYPGPMFPGAESLDRMNHLVSITQSPVHNIDNVIKKDGGTKHPSLSSNLGVADRLQAITAGVSVFTNKLPEVEQQNREHHKHDLLSKWFDSLQRSEYEKQEDYDQPRGLPSNLMQGKDKKGKPTVGIVTNGKTNNTLKDTTPKDLEKIGKTPKDGKEVTIAEISKDGHKKTLKGTESFSVRDIINHKKESDSKVFDGTISNNTIGARISSRMSGIRSGSVDMMGMSMISKSGRMTELEKEEADFVEKYKIPKAEMVSKAERWGIQLDNVLFLKEEFDIYDADGSGSIDATELRTLLEKIDENLTEEEFQAALEEIDEDGTGEVDFFEFLEWFADGD